MAPQQITILHIDALLACEIDNGFVYDLSYVEYQQTYIIGNTDPIRYDTPSVSDYYTQSTDGQDSCGTVSKTMVVYGSDGAAIDTSFITMDD